MRTNPTSRRWVRLLALLALLGLLAAACGGDDSESSTTEQPSEDGESTGDDPTTDLTPAARGDVAFAVEADADGYNPAQNLWSISQQFIGSALYDSLAYETGDGDLEMGLADSIEPNENATVWTITTKEGITFHDGTPFNAEVVKANIDARLANPLSSAAIEPIDEVVVIDPRTVEVRMKRPWTAYDHTLAAQGGYMTSLANAPDAAAELDPVGTGPFQFVEWVPDSHLTVEKNPDYHGGEVYLDSIRFEFISDTSGRENALLAGDVDGMITNEGSTILAQRDNDDLVVYEHASEPTHVLLNAGAPPFDNILARQALAYGTNPESLLVTLGMEDLTGPVDSAFINSNPWYTEDNGYPEFDQEMARSFVEQYEAETGEPLEFEIIAGQGILTDDASSLVEQWDAIGIDAALVPTQQAELISSIFPGAYQAAMWRNHSWIDPDFSYIFWIGGGGINFTNIADDDLDAALEAGRATLDPDERSAAYDQVQQSLNEVLSHIWLYETVWGILTQTNLHGFDDAIERGFSRQDAKPFWSDVWQEQ